MQTTYVIMIMKIFYRFKKMPLHKCSFVTWSQLRQTVAEIVWEVLENVTFNVLLLQLFL